MSSRASQTSQVRESLPTATEIRGRLNRGHGEQISSCKKAIDRNAHRQRMSDEQGQQRDG